MMSRKWILAVSTMVTALSFTVRAASPEGFYVWSDGSNSTRELKWQKLKAGIGPVGEAKTLVKRGQFSDIQCCISFDGKWVAFSRELESIKCCYDGPGDYQMYGNYDIWVVRIDGDLPAKPKRVGKGYWPSWGDDSHGPTKTLYYSWVPGKGRDKGQELKIMKVTVGPDGTISTPEEHVQLPTSSNDPGMQCSPNGRYVVGRISGGSSNIYNVKNKTRQKISGAGYHPSWGSDSFWLYWARYNIGAFLDGKIKGKFEVPYSYHCSFSQDMKWVIGRADAKGKDQNTPHPLSIRSAEFSKIGEEVKGSTKHELDLPKGTWCDLHVWPVHSSADVINGPLPLFKAWQVKTVSGNLQISVDLPGNYSLGLYNIKGIRRSILFNQGTSFNLIPMEDTPTGSYILHLNSEGKTSRKQVSISK